jgi:hypothetical protein
MNNREHNWNRILTKFGRKCAVCGETNVDILQIDHKDPNTKEFEVKARLSSSWIKLSEEVDKCQLLCKPCHDEKTRTTDKKKIKIKKEEFINQKDTFLPLFNRTHREITIQTNKRDGKAWMKLLEYRSKNTGHSVDDLIYKDQIIYEALTYIAFYDLMCKGIFPDKKFQKKHMCDVERVVDRIKKETPNVYDELYENVDLIADDFTKNKNDGNLEQKKKQKSFKKVIDEIIDKDTKYSYICDTLVDETLKLYDVFYRDVRFE